MSHDTFECFGQKPMSIFSPNESPFNAESLSPCPDGPLETTAWEERCARENLIASKGIPPTTGRPTAAWDPEGEARKSLESATKPRLELVPWAAVTEIAEVLTFGAEKYDANNWCRGARWGRYFAALCRHIFAWWSGEEKDPETGKSHLAHAGCCLFFLMEYQRNTWGTDDRFKGPDNQPFVKHDT